MNAELQTLQSELAQSLSGLDADQTQFRPLNRPANWTIQQIVEHLLLTYSSTESAINARLAKRTPTRATPTLLQRVQQSAVTRFGYFPTGREAPPPVTPHPTICALSGEDLAAAAAQHLTNLDLHFTEAEALFGPLSHCASHAVLGPLQIGQWRRFQLVHGRHHIRQILAIRRSHRIDPD